MTALEISDLRKEYGKVVAVDGVGLTVERGQVYGLLGPNGAGKTTTLACALGYLRPTAGEVKVLGERRIERTRGRVGVVSDRSALLAGLSVREYLRYIRGLLGHTGGRQPDEALELVGMGGLGGRRAGKLSMGQSKRLTIAGALLGKPELLVLDEPLAGLDTLGVRGMLRLISDLAGEGLTLIVSSHRLHEMESIVTHAGILLSGKLVRSGTLDELLAGRDGRVRIDVDTVERAREVLDRLGAEVLEVEPAHGGHAETEPEDSERLTSVHARIPCPSAELARALVEGGVEVHALVPERTSLLAVFEDLVDAGSAVA